MDKVLNSPGGPNSSVNLPLLSMGAAILGNRSNSLAGAIGAGGQAYTETAQKQSAQNMELMQKMMMAHYYEGRNQNVADRNDMNRPYIAAKIAKLEQMPKDSAISKQYNQLVIDLQTKQGMSADQAKAQAAASFPDQVPGATAPSNAGQGYAPGTTRTNNKTGETQTWDAASGSWQ